MARRAVALAVVVACVAGIGGAHAQGCSWPTKFDTDTFNAAYPDDNAHYWIAHFVSAPAGRMVIRGTYTRARYFSFHVYDEAQHPVDGIADIALDPDDGSLNPYRTPGAEPGTYTAFVSFAGKPTYPAANTIYGGETNEGLPNPGGALIYRVYVGEGRPQGTADLPLVTLETADGAVAIEFEQCDPLPPSTGGALNQAIKDASYPEQAPRGVPYPPGDAVFRRFYSTEDAVLNRFPANPVSDAVPRSEGGYLSNVHIAYLFALFSREHGDLFVVRAKAPSGPSGSSPSEGTDQVRYWSICQNELATQRFVECLRNDEVVLDADGRFTLAISDPDDRPSNAENWIPWGGAFYDGNVIYRHMLPRADFAEAIQNVPRGSDPATIMGDFFPEGVYCDRATFEADPDACFA